MAITLVQSAHNSTTTGNGTLTVPITSSGAGHMIAICLVWQSSFNPTITSLTDSQSNVYVQAVQSANDGNGDRSDIYYLQNCPSGITSVTASFNFANTNLAILVFEFAGVQSFGTILDQTGALAQTAAPVSPSLTPTTANELVLVCARGVSSLTGVNSPFTAVVESGALPAIAAYNILSGISTQQATFTPTTSQAYTSSGATFVALQTKMRLDTQVQDGTLTPAKLSQTTGAFTLPSEINTGTDANLALQLTQGGGITLASTGTNPSGNITITTPNTNNATPGTGGSITLTSGTVASGGGSTTGGSITLTSGNSQNNNSTGGSLTLTSGQAGGGTAQGGSILLTSGFTAGTATGGNLTLTTYGTQPSNSANNALGGTLKLTSGDVSFGANTGANLLMTTGRPANNVFVTNTGGSFVMTTGVNFSTGTNTGGSITLTTGGGGSSNIGGNITLTAGSTPANGGSIVLTGTGANGTQGSPAHGNIYCNYANISRIVSTGGLMAPLADSLNALQFTNAAGSATLVNYDTTNGRVGIGPTSPAYSLDVGGGGWPVAGTGHFTSDLTIDTKVNVNTVKARSGGLTLSPFADSTNGVLITNAAGSTLMQFDTSVHRADFINPAGGDILVDPNGGRLVINTWATAVDAVLYLNNPNTGHNWYVVNIGANSSEGTAGQLAIYHAAGTGSGSSPLQLNTTNEVVATVKLETPFLSTTAGVNVVDTANNYLLHTNGTATVQFSANPLGLYDSAGNLMVNWTNGRLMNAGAISLEWLNRKLRTPNQSEAWSWFNNGFVYSLINVGIGASTAPNSNLDVQGSVGMNLVTVSGTTYTVLSTDYTVLGNATSNNIAITGPSAASFTRRILNFKKTDSSANTVTITPSSGTIDGAASVVLGTQYQSVTIQSDGTNWWIL